MYPAIIYPPHINGSIEEKQKEIAKLKAELSKAESQIDNLLEARRLGYIEGITLAERIKIFESRSLKLNLDIAKAEGELSFLTIKRDSEHFVVDKMKTFASMFPFMTFDERRAIVEELVDSITMTDDEIIFSLYYLPFFQKELSALEESVRTGAPVDGLETHSMNVPAHPV